MPKTGLDSWSFDNANDVPRIAAQSTKSQILQVPLAEGLALWCHVKYNLVDMNMCLIKWSNGGRMIFEKEKCQWRRWSLTTILPNVSCMSIWKGPNLTSESSPILGTSSEKSKWNHVFLSADAYDVPFFMSLCWICCCHLFLRWPLSLNILYY